MDKLGDILKEHPVFRKYMEEAEVIKQTQEKEQSKDEKAKFLQTEQSTLVY